MQGQTLAAAEKKGNQLLPREANESSEPASHLSSNSGCQVSGLDSRDPSRFESCGPPMAHRFPAHHSFGRTTHLPRRLSDTRCTRGPPSVLRCRDAMMHRKTRPVCATKLGLVPHAPVCATSTLERREKRTRKKTCHTNLRQCHMARMHRRRQHCTGEALRSTFAPGSSIPAADR